MLNKQSLLIEQPQNKKMNAPKSPELMTALEQQKVKCTFEMLEAENK